MSKLRLIQISSGKGPVECELAVGKYLHVFLENHKTAQIIEESRGNYTQCYKSVLLEIDDREEVILGSIKWICQSPFRKHHKRKNWFIEISEIAVPEHISDEKLNLHDKSRIRFETFRSGGKGGQNVNKVETGVRVIHLETSIVATSTSARTQLQNKKIALNRLIQILMEQNIANKNLLEENKWLEHERLVRGNAVAVYEGVEFRLK